MNATRSDKERSRGNDIRISVILFGLALLATSACQTQARQATPPIQVTGGAISGTETDGMRTFFGVPFAAPPIGDLRWRAPQPVTPWQGVKQATAFSPACAQTATWVSNPRSEDCLYLNIWAPPAAKNLPVIIWIHGGAMDSGTAALPVQNGANLAKRGAIVITINYRLGIFGFFAHPELSAEAPSHVSGNQGILDQIAALRWVRANIAAFGGDSDRMTIMGCSSGGESVAVLVASPLAKGLFQRAIAESGNDAMPIGPEDRHRFDEQPAAEVKALAFARSVGVEHLGDLRALSVTALQAQAWLPRVHVDGNVLRSDMSAIYRRHRQNDVPLLVGWNAEEGTDLVGFYLDTSKLTATGHRSNIARLLGYPPSATLLAAYPGTTDAEAATSIKRLTNDWWGWRMAHWAGLQAKYGRSRSYVYYFAHRPAEPPTACSWACGAGHGVEVQYMLDNLAVDPRVWSAEDRRLANRLADTVVRFARTGNPSGRGAPAWPTYDGSNRSILPIGNEKELQAGPLPDFSLFPQ